MSGPRYDLVPPAGQAQPRPKPQPRPEGPVLDACETFSAGKIIFSVAVALATGVLIAKGLYH